MLTRCRRLLKTIGYRAVSRIIDYKITRYTRYKTLDYGFIRYGLLALLAGLTIVACSSGPFGSTVSLDKTSETTSETISARTSKESLIVLWDKGYVTEEDEAIQKVVDDWNAQSDLQVELSFYNSGEIAPRTLRFSQAGQSPDILFAAKSVYPVSDWDGKLADVSDVVSPLLESYTEVALRSAKVYGSEKAGDRYYAVPLNQSTTHIYYWKDLLQEAGYRPADIPAEWDDFWAFWQTVQDNLAPAYPGLRSIGLPYSKNASDTYHIFEHVLSAYNVTLVDAQGKLLVDDPTVKAGIVDCLNWYLQFYKAGYAPSEAVRWLDPENNRNFLNRAVVMTPNPTMSIPAAVRNDDAIYLEQLGTVPFPNKPDGAPLPHFVSIRQAVVFADAPNVRGAKDFLTYLTQPAVLSDFLKASYGRYIPPSIGHIEADLFWQDAADPHVSAVVETVMAGQTQPFQNVYNPAYGMVMEQNVWGQAVYDVAMNNMSAEEAATAAIAQIKSIFQSQL